MSAVFNNVQPSLGKREKILVAYGGKSVEHEISVITALQAMQSLDPLKYEIIPLYISPRGSWHTGKALLERRFYKNWQENLNKTQEVTCLPSSTFEGLYPIKNKTVDLSSPIHVDVALMAFHGQYGEDGCLQALFECAAIPYTGSPVTAAALAMNKHLCKDVVSRCGISTLAAYLITRERLRSEGLKFHTEQAINSLKNSLASADAPWPLFVKPNNLGSSIGVGRAHNLQELEGAIAHALRYDHEVLIEPCLDNLMEINVSVLDGDPVRASVVEIPVATSKVLSYEDKYLRGGKGKMSSSPSQGMAGLTRKIDPKDLDPSIQKQAQDWAIEAFKALGCSGVVRIDFMFDLTKGQLYFNELNTIPGSLAFYLWEKSHPRLLYPELLSNIINRAKERMAQHLCSERQIEFKALSRD